MIEPITFGTVCTGIGGFDLGFERAGMQCEWMIEIDAPCRSVLSLKFPHATIYEDATKDNPIKPVRVVAGGTPCQGFSIAGMRGGLEDERSNLCLRFVEICDQSGADILVWENVPGALSMPDNAFGCFIAALVGFDSPLVHPDGPTFDRYWRDDEKSGGRFPVWPRAGMVTGPRRTACWRVLDSQYFGVAQRRERLFVVADSFAPERSMGEAELRERQRLYGVATKILFESEMLRRHSAPSRTKREDVASTLGSGPPGSGPRTDYERMTFVPQVARMQAMGQYEIDDVASTMKERDHKDATDLVISPPLTTRMYADNASKEGQIVIGFDKARGEHTGELSGTLRCNGGKADGVNDGKADNQCIAFDTTQITSKTNRSNPQPGAPCHPLASTAHPPAITTSVVQKGLSVRRLTPVECERLQSFPDDWNLFGAAKQQKDSPRYRQLGNAITESVARWIGKRIVFYLRNPVDAAGKGK